LKRPRIRFWPATAEARRGRLARRRECWFYLLISPWLVGLILFQSGPILGALLLSFIHWPLPQAPRFVGLAQLGALVADRLFWRALANSVYYAAGSIAPSMALGLALALAFRPERRATHLLRAVVFLPVILPGVATAFVWGWMFNPRYGAINALLAAVGVRGPGWLFDEAWAMPALILMSLWSAGSSMLVYLAALRSVPAELYEAAALDGAGRWSAFRHITWPLLSPATSLLLTINMIAAMQVFTPTYALTRGGPNNATLTLPLCTYFNAFVWGRLGYASAQALALFALILGLTLLQMRVSRGKVFYMGGEG